MTKKPGENTGFEDSMLVIDLYDYTHFLLTNVLYALSIW